MVTAVIGAVIATFSPFRADAEEGWRWVQSSGRFVNCAIKIHEDWFKELPADFPRSSAAYPHVRLWTGPDRVCNLDGPQPTRLKPVEPGTHLNADKTSVVVILAQMDGSGTEVRSINIRTKWRNGEPFGNVSVHAKSDDMQDSVYGHLVGNYEPSGGRYTNSKVTAAKKAGQTIVTFGNDREGIDVEPLRKSGAVLGIKLGTPLSDAIKSNAFAVTSKVYDRPCGKPVQVADGLAGGNKLRVSSVDGKVSEIAVNFHKIRISERTDAVEFANRFGRPAMIYGETTHKYAFYGTPLDANVKKHKVAPVTVLQRNLTSYEVRFNDVPLQLQLLAHLSECREKAALALFGVVGEVAKPVVKAIAEEMGKPRAVGDTDDQKAESNSANTRRPAAGRAAERAKAGAPADGPGYKLEKKSEEATSTVYVLRCASGRVHWIRHEHRSGKWCQGSLAGCFETLPSLVNNGLSKCR